MATASFTCFSELPVEIQDYIWTLAYNAECPRAFFAVLNLVSASSPNQDGSPVKPWWQHFQYDLQRIVPPDFIIPCLTDPIDTTPRGILRKTCKASRKIASKSHPVDLPIELQEGPKQMHRMVPSGPKAKSLRLLAPPPISQATVDAARTLVIFHPDLAIYGVSARPFPPEEVGPEGLKDYSVSSARLRYLGVLWVQHFAEREFTDLGSRGFFNLFISFPQLRKLYIILHPKDIPEAADKPLQKVDPDFFESLDSSGEEHRHRAFDAFRWRDMDFFEVPSELVVENGRHEKLLKTMKSLEDVASSWYDKIGLSKNQLAVRVMTWRVIPWEEDASGHDRQEAAARALWDCEGYDSSEE